MATAVLPALTWERCPDPATIDALVLKFCELECQASEACDRAVALDELMEAYRERLLLIVEQYGEPHAEKSKLLAGAGVELVADDANVPRLQIRIR